MCARFKLTPEDYEEIRKILREIDKKLNGRQYKLGEIFPTDTVPVVIDDNGQYGYDLFSWGFPKFRDQKGVIINARSETAAEKRMFAGSLRSKRCLIPCSGFYEWSKFDYKKQKHEFKKPDNSFFYLAGLYNVFDGMNKFVVLTTEANKSMNQLHDRMPVLIGTAVAEPWLFDSKFASEYIQTEMSALEHNPVQK